MIVPRNRLLGWVLGGLLPVLAVGGLVRGAGPLALWGAAGLGLLALLDAVAAVRRVAPFAIEYEDVTRLTKDRSAVFTVRVRHAQRRPARLRLGVPFPREVRPDDETVWTDLPAGAEAALVPLRCVGLRRGSFVVEGCHLEADSPLGLWSGRRRVACRGEIRVYPNIFPDRRTVAGLFLDRGSFGIHPRRQVGKGREFEQLRDYVVGDSYDEIHWKATARRGRPVTKMFQVERTQEVCVVLDASRLSTRLFEMPGAQGDGDPAEIDGAVAPAATMLDRFLTASLVLGQVAQRQGDHFGLVAFSDQVDRFVPARSGKTHYGLCRDALYALEPRFVTPDFREVFRFLRARLRRRTLLVFLTSLDDPALAEDFTSKIDLLARHHLVLVNMPTPPGVQPLFSPGAGDVANLDGMYGQLAGHLRWRELMETRQTLRRRGVAFSLLDRERLCAEIVSQYLDVKKRQAL